MMGTGPLASVYAASTYLHCVFGNYFIVRTKPREISALTVLVVFSWFPPDNIV